LSLQNALDAPATQYHALHPVERHDKAASVNFVDPRIEGPQAPYPANGSSRHSPLADRSLDIESRVPASSLPTAYDANVHSDALFRDTFSAVAPDFNTTGQGAEEAATVVHTNPLDPKTKTSASSRTRSKPKIEQKEKPYDYGENEDEQLRTDYDVEVPRPTRRLLSEREYGT